MLLIAPQQINIYLEARFKLKGKCEEHVLTSNVISRWFLGICITPLSPSSPDTHIHGFDVVIALLSFLMGIITDL